LKTLKYGWFDYQIFALLLSANIENRLIEERETARRRFFVTCCDSRHCSRRTEKTSQ